jgi:hypothetical protein
MLHDLQLLPDYSWLICRCGTEHFPRSLLHSDQPRSSNIMPQSCPRILPVQLQECGPLRCTRWHFCQYKQPGVSNKSGSTAFVPTMFGTCHDDGASIGATYPATLMTSEAQGIEESLGISASYAQEIINSGLFPFYSTGNLTLNAFNVSARVSTDRGFRCIDQATTYSGVVTGAFAASYYYVQDRTIEGYDPNNMGGPPVTPGCPNGNPNHPYFRFHSGATAPFIFGNVSPIHNPDDLYAAQLNSEYFASFVKDRQPNPSERYLQKRGYTATLEAVEQTGRWASIRGTDGPIRLLDYPSTESPFLDVPQCAFLNYSLNYYLEGGS